MHPVERSHALRIRRHPHKPPLRDALTHGKDGQKRRPHIVFNEIDDRLRTAQLNRIRKGNALLPQIGIDNLPHLARMRHGDKRDLIDQHIPRAKVGTPDGNVRGGVKM